MKLDKLFNVLVVAGASSTAGLGLFGCGGDDDDGGSGDGGLTASGGGSSAGGSSSTGGSGAGTGGSSGDACEAACGPSSAVASWTDCNGCCCWLAVGDTTTTGSPICGEEPCCAGKGPGR